MKYRLSPTGAYPSKASFAASSASSSGVRLMRPSAVGENCATPPRRSNTTSLTLLGEALVRHAVEHDVADRDLPVHGLVAGLGIDDVAEPIDITRAVIALAALEQRLLGGIDAQTGMVLAEHGRYAEDLLQIRQRQHHFPVEGIHAVGRVEAAAVARVVRLAVGRRDVRAVDRDGLGVAVRDRVALEAEHLGERIRREPDRIVEHVAVAAAKRSSTYTGV